MTRKKAIEILEEIIDEGWLISDFEKCTAIDACEMAIKALEQEPKWIPVSDRLPKEGYSVLVTRITDDNCKYVRIASYQGDCWMDNTDEFNKPNSHKVIAWQPLPKPYEPQERSDKE